jgi:hypothetical protein
VERQDAKPRIDAMSVQLHHQSSVGPLPVFSPPVRAPQNSSTDDHAATPTIGTTTGTLNVRNRAPDSTKINRARVACVVT